MSSTDYMYSLKMHWALKIIIIFNILSFFDSFSMKELPQNLK